MLDRSELERVLEGRNYGEDHDAVLERITELMRGNSKWRVDVQGFGWQKQSFSYDMTAEGGRQLLQSILPDADCTYIIYVGGDDSLWIQNFHHDNNEGDEFYKLTPASTTSSDDDV